MTDEFALGFSLTCESVAMNVVRGHSDWTVASFLEWEARLVASMMHYVMLEQDRVAATVFSRTGGDWIGRLVTGDGKIALPELGLSMPLSEFFEGIESVEN